jgi:hypothetical protein
LDYSGLAFGGQHCLHWMSGFRRLQPLRLN